MQGKHPMVAAPRVWPLSHVHLAKVATPALLVNQVGAGPVVKRVETVSFFVQLDQQLD